MKTERELHVQRRTAARAAGASLEAALRCDELTARAHRFVAAHPNVSFTVAMKETIRANPSLKASYEKAVNQQGARAASGTQPMQYHCRECDEQLHGEDVTHDKRRAVCSSCGAVHELDDATAEALGEGTVRVAKPLDEAGGDADALEHVEDVPPVQAIASRNRDGSPVVLSDLQQRIRQNQRRRLRDGEPVL